MNEQPQQPETPKEDLFEWGEKQTKPKPEKDDLGWDCPQCELNGGWCASHPRSDYKQSLGKEEHSFDKVIEREIEIENNLKKMEEPLSQEEIDAFFEEMKKKTSS